MIFFVDEDYARFTSNLKKYSALLKFDVYAYCLMPNHFHLLIKAGKVHLSKIMQKLVTAYTMYLNKKYNRVGHIFQGRFKSIVIEKESYFLKVATYIHLNPVEAGLVKLPGDYLWSSYPEYLSSKNSMNVLKDKQKTEVFNLLSGDKTKAVELFKEYTLKGMENKFDPFQEQSRGFLGGDKFRQMLTKVSGGRRP